MNNKIFMKYLLATLCVLCLTGTYNISAVTRQFNLVDKKPARNKTVQPSVSTDKTSFSVGENIVITGNGFNKFEQINIQIEQIDYSQSKNNLLAEWIEFAGQAGNIVSNWNLPSEGRFLIKLTGNESKQQTQTVIASCVTPVFVSGNPTCANINASGNPAFAHIQADWGLKIEPPVNGNFTFINSTGSVLQGGATTDTGNSVRLTFTSGTTVNWSSTRSIKAVIVKAGAGANVYPYDPFAFSDTALNTPGGLGFSHLVFCYANSVTTAARVSAGGRVTDEFGNGIARATLTILNSNTSEMRSTVTNTFGYYRFDELEVGNFYVITAFNKKYSFEENTQSFVLNDAIENLDFRVSSK